MLSGAAACHVYDTDPDSCARAWAVTQNQGQPVSCFYVEGSGCQGCGPNQPAGTCTNRCITAAAVPATTRWAACGLVAALLTVGAARTRGATPVRCTGAGGRR